MNDEEPIVFMPYTDWLEYQSQDSVLKLEMPKIGGRYERSSDPSINYNCLSWAVGMVDTFLDPQGYLPGYSWPSGVERSWNMSGCRALLESYGYAECADNSFERGFTKVAMFVSADGKPTHFARQVHGDKWTSKLGDLIDIVHDDLVCLECSTYGTAKYFFKKEEPKSIWPPIVKTPNAEDSQN